MSRLSEVLITQAIVRYHKGAGGGSAWIKWGLDAIDRFRQAGSSYDETAIAEIWRRPNEKWSGLLYQSTPAGNALLACGVLYGQGRVDAIRQPVDPKREFPQGIEARIHGEAVMWARYLATLIGQLYRINPNVREVVRRVATEQGEPYDKALNLDRADNLINAAAMLLRLQDQMNVGTWKQLKVHDLSVDDARHLVDHLHFMKPQTKAHFEERSYFQDIVRKIFGDSRGAVSLDGLTLELLELEVAHTPSTEGPFYSSVRDQLIELVQKYMTEAPMPRSTGSTIGRATTVLLRMADEVVIERIVGWMTEYPNKAVDFFSEERFDCYLFEIDRRGKRRDLWFGTQIELVQSKPPETARRQYAVEVFRPIGGTCDTCGNRLLALFDLKQDILNIKELPIGRRVLLPVCENCIANNGSYKSKLRVDDLDPERYDVDVWSVDEETRKFNGRVRWYRPRQAGDESLTKHGWIGGLPRFEQEPEFPRCDTCKRKMIFLGQVGLTPTYYGYFCDSCRLAHVATQYD